MIRSLETVNIMLKLFAKVEAWFGLFGCFLTNFL